MLNACCMQICRWEFLTFSGTFKTLLDVHEEPEAGKVVFSLIKSAFMKDFEGQWQVSSLINCRTMCRNHVALLQLPQHVYLLLTHWVARVQLTDNADGGCHVEHKLTVQPVLDAPALFSKCRVCTLPQLPMSRCD